MSRSYSASEPSHQTTRLGAVRVAASSTHFSTKRVVAIVGVLAVFGVEGVRIIGSRPLPSHLPSHPACVERFHCIPWHRALQSGNRLNPAGVQNRIGTP